MGRAGPIARGIDQLLEIGLDVSSSDHRDCAALGRVDLGSDAIDPVAGAR